MNGIAHNLWGEFLQQKFDHLRAVLRDECVALGFQQGGQVVAHLLYGCDDLLLKKKFNFFLFLKTNDWSFLGIRYPSTSVFGYTINRKRKSTHARVLTCEKLVFGPCFPL